MNAGLRLENIAHIVTDAGVDKAVLAPLSYDFVPGQFNVVGGPSGAGKTTLLSILSLSVRAARGAIYDGNQNLSVLSLSGQLRWRKDNLGLIFQSSRLIGVMTALEHIRLAASLRGRPEAEARGVEILAALGMADKLHHMPTQLSGGEKQRVAIAQALCCQPKIILADEPTAALDHDNAALVAQTLRRYAYDKSAVVICVSHDRAVIDAADNFLMLEKP